MLTKNHVLGALKSNGITVPQFAKLCGISTATFYRHLRDLDQMTYKEIRMLRRYCNEGNNNLF